MGTVNYGRLVSLFESQGEAQAVDTLKDTFAADRGLARNIDLGRVFTECFGWGHFLAVRNREVLANQVMSQALTEAEGAVSTSAFLNITGQIVYSTLLEAYESEEFVFQKLIPEAPTQFLDGEKIAGITRIGNEALPRKESDPYIIAGVGEDWIFTPPVVDRGFIVPVTWEAVFADRTGMLLDRCKEVGYWVGYSREERAVDCVIDENVTQHRYNWRGTVIATYGDNSGTHTWDNLSGTTSLVDWSSLNTVEVLMSQLLDPYTATPYMQEAKDLIVSKANEQTARRIVHATEIRVATPGYATTGNPTQTNMANPYNNKYRIHTSRLLGARQNINTTWYLSDLSKFAKYMVAERLQVAQAPSGAPEEFNRRIVAQFRANERGAYVTVQPRASTKATVS